MRPGQEGFLLGQSASYGLTQQSTIVPGVTQGVSKPAAGAGFSMTLQPYDRWRLVAIQFQLVTSSTSANRVVTVDYSGVGSVGVMSDPVPAVVVASKTQRFYGALNYGSGFAATNGDISFPLSGLWLEPGSTVKLTVGSIDTTDQLSGIALTFDRWPENPIDYGDENEVARVLNEVAEGFEGSLKRMRAALYADTYRREHT